MPPETARSWDSYMDTLLIVLSEFKPAHILEFGSGKSTGIMAMAPSVTDLFTLEHDQEYFAKFNKAAFDNLEMRHVPNEDEYATCFPRKKIYDLVFVDGVNRARCMREVQPYLSHNGIVMLHDAAREEYEDAVKRYKYAVWTDGGHTVCLTDELHVYDKLQMVLAGLKNKIGVKS